MRGTKEKVQTVCGPIDPMDLGPTLMHEHVVADYTPPAERGLPATEITLENHFELSYHWVDYPGMRRLTDPEVAVKEMTWMLEAGGKSVVDVSTPGMTIFPERLREVAERAGVHIVIGCGRYYDDEGFMTPEERERTVDDLAGEFIRHLQEGFNGTGIKAGLIGEIGCSCPWTEAEKRSVRAAVLAQEETGAALSIHPGRGDPEAPFEIVAFLEETGADLSRTIIDHNERRLPDVESVLRLAARGIVIELDMFGQETSFFAAQGKAFDLSGDGARLTSIRALIDAGHGDRIVIAHDICQKPRLASFGGHGYSHIFRNVLPMMRGRNFNEDEIDTLLVKTPRRLLTFS